MLTARPSAQLMCPHEASGSPTGDGTLFFVSSGISVLLGPGRGRLGASPYFIYFKFQDSDLELLFEKCTHTGRKKIIAIHCRVK